MSGLGHHVTKKPASARLKALARHAEPRAIDQKPQKQKALPKSGLWIMMRRWLR
jgi:hypothetical protein